MQMHQWQQPAVVPHSPTGSISPDPIVTSIHLSWGRMEGRAVGHWPERSRGSTIRGSMTEGNDTEIQEFREEIQQSLEQTRTRRP